MGYVHSRIVVQLLCVGTFAISISIGCQLSNSSDQCQQGWYQVEHKCILLPNTSVVKHLAASDGCKRMGGKLLSYPISEQVTQCILSLIIGKRPKEIWIAGKKSQQCGTMNLITRQSGTVTCNQTVTTPRSFVCESNSSSATTTASPENIIQQTPTRAIGLPTFVTRDQTTPKEIDCPVGFERVYRGCYKFVQEQLDWEEALTTCKESNGDLSEILSTKEMDDVQKYLATHYQDIQSWWMGFKRAANTEWAWLGGWAVNPNMIPWRNPALMAMKRELCGTIEIRDSKFLISGARCSSANPFICEYHAITPRHVYRSTTPEMPIEDSGANTDMVSFTTLNGKQTGVSTEVSTTHPSDWIATITSTATPRADVKAPTTSEVPSTTKQTVLVKEPTRETETVSSISLPEEKTDSRIDGERNESSATSAVPLTSTTEAVPLTSTTSESLLTTSSGKHDIDTEGNHTQNSSTGMVKPRLTDVSTAKSITTAAPSSQPLLTSSETKVQDGVDEARTHVSTNGPVAWTTSFGSTTTATTGSEVSGPPTPEVPSIAKQPELVNEPTKEKVAGKVESDENNTNTANNSFARTTPEVIVTEPNLEVTPGPRDCPRDVKISSMGQDSVTFMWRHQAEYDNTEFRIIVFDNASNRIFAPNSPQVSDGAYTYISVTSLDHTTDYRFKIGYSLSNVTEDICDEELPKNVYCSEDRQEEVTFLKTRGGVTLEVPCPPNYEGNITRTCDDKTRSWTPFSQYNCTRKSLRIASNLARDLSNESSEVLMERMKNISSEVTSALESNTDIVSGDIKQIVNILEQIGKASDRSAVSNETLQNLATITDKLIEADTSTWDELSTANKTENAGSALLKAMDDITSSYLKSGNVTETLIVQKNIVINVASTGEGKDNITFPKVDHATYSTNQTSNKVFLSSEALSGPVTYSVIIYTNVSDKFKVDSSSSDSSEQQRIGSDVISFSLSAESTRLSSPLILTFKTGESRAGAVCSFLDTKSNISGVWSTDGCKTILKETTVDCQCSHLTNFAVLMSMSEPQVIHQTILSYVSVIGISISLFCLCLTVTVYSVMWRYVKSDRSVLHMNLCACLMLGYTVFLGGISKTEHRIACAVAAALLHYLFLAVFFVMLSQGLLILKSVTSVSSVSILRYLYILMYGAPLVIVATSLGVTRGEGFGTDKACWLSPHNGVLWAFVGPALSIVVVNFFILFAVIRIMQKSRFMTDKDVKRKTKSVVRSIFILAPILGVTWVLGVLSVTVDLAIFQYSFAICNSLQGLFIFIFQCVLQYQIKDGFRALLRRYRATSLDSSQRMLSTGQSQEKGCSESGQKTTSMTNTSGTYKSQE